jgi:hypothetical protein
MRRLLFFPTLLSFAYCFSTVAAAQTESFSDKNVDFNFDLPSPEWRLVARPNDLRATVEVVYGDRSDGYLRARKEVSDSAKTAADFARLDQDQKLRYRPGYVEGKQERFTGNLNGMMVSYEFTTGGKPMSGRIYYLEAKDGSVYTLHFTGARDKLARIRNQTDLIARSLKQK